MAGYSELSPTLTASGPDEAGILVVGINRPDAKNALDGDTIAALGRLLEQAREDAAVKAVVITGEGKVFGIGADIPEIKRLGVTDEAVAMIGHGHKVYRQIEHYPKPVCAAINGVFCLGGSLELALACHLRVVGKKCRLGLPEVSLGLIPGYGGTQRLARQIGKGRAMELVLTGEMVRASAAVEMGLCNREADAGDEVKEAKELLGKVLANAPLALQTALKAISEGLDGDLPAGLELERELFIKLRGSRDADEGLDANLERRKPQFTGQ